MEFSKRKAAAMAAISDPSPDKSSKGTLDQHLLPLLDAINLHPSFFTTSSCSGRITILSHPHPDPTGKQPSKKKAGGGTWLITSHDPVDPEMVLGVLFGKEGRKSEEGGMLVFRFEPVIVAVECRDVEAARLLVRVAVDAGLRESGITSLNKRVMVAVRCSIRLEVPLGDVNELMVSPEYVRYLVGIANEKMEANRSRTDVFLQAFLNQHQSAPKSCGNLDNTAATKKPWSIDEDEALISSFMTISCEAIVNTNKKSGQLWRKINDTYDLICETNPNVAARNMDSLKGRWRRIGTAISKWTACYDEAVARRRSDMNDEDVIREAHAIHERMHHGKFYFYHAWVMLRRHPKWQPMMSSSCLNIERGRPKRFSPTAPNSESSSSGKRIRTDDSDDFPTPTVDVNFGDSQPYVWLEGVKEAKKKGKTVQESSNNITTLSESIRYSSDQKCRIEKEKIDFLREKLQMKERKMKFEWLKSLSGNPSLTEEEKKLKKKLTDELNEKFLRNQWKLLETGVRAVKPIKKIVQSGTNAAR